MRENDITGKKEYLRGVLVNRSEDKGKAFKQGHHLMMIRWFYVFEEGDSLFGVLLKAEYHNPTVQQ